MLIEKASSGSPAPTCSVQTQLRYRRRARNLLLRYRTDLSSTDPIERPTNVVTWLASLKGGWRPASWRQNKAALTHVFKEHLAALRHQIAGDPGTRPDLVSRLDAVTESLVRLAAETEAGCASESRKTSASKAKRLSDRDRDQLAGALARSRSRYAPALLLYLTAGVRTGLRPHEWRNVAIAIAHGSGPGDLVLTVTNAKHDDLRANGSHRTLTWHGLDGESCDAIRHWIAIAHAAEASGTYDALLEAMGQLMHDTTRKLWPRRRVRPTLYTLRHRFAALAKLVFDAAEVAALLGHASDETASRHYGRYRRGATRFAPRLQADLAALPIPNPVEVARVRRLLDGRMARLADLAGKPGAAIRPS